MPRQSHPEPVRADGRVTDRGPTSRPAGLTAWAKTDPARDGEPALSLTDHSVDVGAVSEMLLGLVLWRQRLSALAGRQLDEVDVARLSFLAALHDFGKAVHAFQRRIREGTRASHTAPAWRVLGSQAYRGDVRREVAAALGRREWRGWFEDREAEGAHWDVVMAHHGSLPVNAPVPDRRQWADGDGGYRPLAAVSDLRETLEEMFSRAFDESPPLPAGPRFLHALTGVVILSDWLGSDRAVFGFPRDGAPTGRARVPWSRARAADLARRRFLEVSDAREAAQARQIVFSGLFPDLAAPRPSQDAVLRGWSKDGRIVILESETGSGKTEAALLHFLRLFREGAVDGLYFALPTRAAAKQIHERVHDTVRRWLGESAPPVVLAVPGYLRVDEDEGQRLPDSHGVLWGESGEASDRGWAAENAKRYLCGAIIVGTIDQALLGGVKARHAHLRSTPMLRLLLCVDEVHASDRYMTVLLRNLLDQHTESGGRALLMSATLGAAARVRLLRPGRRVERSEIPASAAAVAVPYPAIQTDLDERPRSLPAAGGGKEVSLRLVDFEDGLPALMEEIVRAAAGGAAVLFIRNRVTDCVEAMRRLEAMGAPLLRCCGVAAPHHGRFAPADRRLLDSALEDAFGATRRGVVAVTTQTAEQSLDICADWLVTDLAPGDVLLQRLGRLHRHRHRRPRGFGTPGAVVVCPSASRLADSVNPRSAHRRKGKASLGLGSVYSDLVGILATREWLALRGRVRVPEDNRALVEAATHPDALRDSAAELGGPWPEVLAHHEGEGAAIGGGAKTIALDWERSLLENQPDPDRVALTRLGLRDRRVEFDDAREGPFGSAVRVLDIPAWMLDGATIADDARAESVEQRPGGIRFRFGDRWFGYDRYGLHRPARGSEVAVPADAGEVRAPATPPKGQTVHPRSAGRGEGPVGQHCRSQAAPARESDPPNGSPTRSYTESP